MSCASFILPCGHAFSSDESRKNAHTYVQLAREYLRIKNLQSALDAADRAVDADRRHVDAHVVRALVAVELGKYPEANRYFRKALSLRSTHSEANHRYANFLCRHTKEQEKAFTHFVVAFADPLYPGHVNVLLDQTRCQMRANRWEEANQGLLSLLGMGENPALLLMMVDVQLSMGQTKLAQFYMDRLSRYTIDPNPTYLLMRIRLARALGNIHDVTSYTEQMKRDFPHARETQQIILEE